MITVTDIFAGAGGSTSGALMIPNIAVELVANHWKLAVDVHQINHPDTEHACVDLHLEDPRNFPRTDVLWASPECTKWSQARGKAEALSIELGGDATLFDQVPEDLITTETDEITRSRLLMFDVLRFIEHHRYRAVVVENVVDIATQAKYAAAWRMWQAGLRNLGYRFRVVSHNAMHAQRFGLPAPQSRDRLYIVAWPENAKAPDIDAVMRPKAWCPRCDLIIESVQAWKPGRTVGKYRRQYVYACSRCGTTVEPGWLPAASAIDWTLRGQRIGDRSKPLAEKTRARIAAGIARHWGPMHLEAAGHTYDAADPNHPAHGDPHAYYRSWPVDEYLRTLHTFDSKALAVPVEGRDGKDAHSLGQPLRTMTTRNETALLTRHYGIDGGHPARHTTPVDEVMRTLTASGGNMSLLLPFVAELRGGGSSARSVCRAAATFTAGGNHHGLVCPAGGTWNDEARSSEEALRALTTRDAYALVAPYYGNCDTAQPASDPLGTVTTRDRHALVMRGEEGGAESRDYGPVTRDDVFLGRWERREPIPAKHQPTRSITPDELAAAQARVDECEFRMFEPHEVAAGMAFPLDYQWLGSRRDRVKLAGNAVCPPAARDLIGAVAMALT